MPGINVTGDNIIFEQNVVGRDNTESTRVEINVGDGETRVEVETKQEPTSVADIIAAKLKAKKEETDREAAADAEAAASGTTQSFGVGITARTVKAGGDINNRDKVTVVNTVKIVNGNG